MMISLSRNATPARLLGDAMRGREIARLEFYPVDRVVEDLVVGEADSGVVEVMAEPMVERQTVEMRLEAEALEIEAHIETARKESRETAREEWQEELEKRLVEERSRIGRVCEEFTRERKKYFADVETEVVRLALAVAARVLHREVKMDPLLLAGVVRVALGKVEEGSATVLRVPVNEVEMWQGVGSNVVGDERLKPGDCVLETSVGKVELGVSAQLEEIERGFFDLLQQRPS
jgi:flagellar assembly protein FliH